jgi:hypothetical protein
MAIIWLKGKSALASKRAAQREQTRLRKSNWKTEIVEKVEGRSKIYGVRYS